MALLCSIAMPAIHSFVDFKSGKLELWSMDMQPYPFAHCTSACRHVSVASRIGQQQPMLRNCVRGHHASLQPMSALSVLPAARSAGEPRMSSPTLAFAGIRGTLVPPPKCHAAEQGFTYTLLLAMRACTWGQHWLLARRLSLSQWHAAASGSQQMPGLAAGAAPSQPPDQTQAAC